jgi:hypothetical protein
MRALLLGMTAHFDDALHVVDDLEIETPVVVHACLPDVARFIEFLGVERRVVEVLLEESKLLEEGFRDRGRRVRQRFLTGSPYSALIATAWLF